MPAGEAGWTCCASGRGAIVGRGGLAQALNRHARTTGKEREIPRGMGLRVKNVAGDKPGSNECAAQFYED
ncbi:hypothetical protein PATSB16_25220 [Pandoraea thiooxydans]|nr:hypothetical protein PATSB16_25220 [Pandoraea thiooxydans]